MQSTDQPTRVELPFAEAGVKRTIPVASQIGITDGAASYTDGFPPKTFLPVAVGGIPPAGADFNGILNDITAILQWLSAGASFKYNAGFSTAVGGYPKGAMLQDATNTKVWINTVENNVTDPDSGGSAGWVSLPDGEGSTRIGVQRAGTGNPILTVFEKLLDIPAIIDFGGVVDGVTDDSPAMVKFVADGDIELRKGSVLLATGLAFAASPYMVGHGPGTKLIASAAFPINTDLFTVSPVAGGGVEKRNIQFRNFLVSNAGTNVKNVFTLDITGAGQYLNKLTISNVIAEAVTGYFVELINPVNTDGLFCSVFEDNWSLNGYHLDKIGDSCAFVRNTVGGTAGVAFYVNQLGTASHIIIRDGNYTTNGGGLYARKSLNLRFDNNQVEVPVVFSGANNAAVSFDSATGAASHQNPQVTNNNINTQANTTLRCIYAQWTNGLIIEGNSLFCNVSTGAHIYVDANANDTYIGLNKYYNSASGAEVTTPLITDLGVGTMGIWKDATLITTWTLISAANGFPVGYFKTRDGVVQLRGNLSGASAGASILLFNLPIGFRPKTKVVTMYKPNAAAVSVAFQIESNGNVTLLTTTATSVYLDGVTFSTR